MRKFIGILMAFVLLLTIAGCASIIHGKFQKISVITEPIGASVKATTGEGNPVQCTTPGILEVDRSLPAYVIHIEKPGYKSVDIVLKRDIDPWFWGNIVLGGLIGVVVDMSTGSAYKFSPDKVNKILETSGVNLSKLDTKKTHIFVVLKEQYPDLDLSECKKIN